MVGQARFAQVGIVDLAKNDGVSLLALFASSAPILGCRFRNPVFLSDRLGLDIKSGRYQQASEREQGSAGRAHREITAAGHGSGHETQSREQYQRASYCHQGAYLL